MILLLLAVSLGAAEPSPQNWTGQYPPCDRHAELLSRGPMDLGVRISTSNPDLARQFEHAMEFWSEVLDLEWHLEDTQNCAVQLVDGAPELFDSVNNGCACISARSQFPNRPAFQGWIAFNPGVRRTEREMFMTSVHEIGHLLGLPHNPSGSSVMFFLRVDGPVWLDASDLEALASRHKLRAGVFERGSTNAATITIP